VLSESSDVPQALSARLLTIPERHPTTVIFLIGLLFAVAYGSSLVLRPKPDGRVVLGDALHHYVQLRSAVFDQDLHFRNEYVRMYGLKGGEPGAEWIFDHTPTGHVRNLMPVGPAILWLPLFLLVNLGLALANLLGATAAVDGYSRWAQASAGFTGILAATIGVWCTWRASALLFSPRAAIWACLTLWLASSALYYSLVSPTYSHAASLLATSVFWYVWLLTRDDQSVRRYAGLGFAAGFAALMRWQDAILLAPIALDLLRHTTTRRLAFGRTFWRGLTALGAAAVAFLPQMLVWTILYGQPFALPQGDDFMRWTTPALISVLFSDWHGLFTWTPVVAVAIAGLVRLGKRHPDICLATGAFLVLSWYVNAAVADWWAGEAFGARRFVSCFAVFVFGLAALIDWWSPRLPRLATASSAVVGYTMLLLVQYQAFMHGLRHLAPYPAGAFDLWFARFVVPFRILREWISR
jgi:hypothetical protein